MNNPAPTLSEARTALQFVSSVCDRDAWVKLAMALKSEFGDQAFELFDSWSQQSDQYKAGDCRSVWKSVSSAGGITIGTLFSRAIDGGYVPEKLELSAEDLAKRKAEEAKRRAAAKARAEKEAAWLRRRDKNCAAVCANIISHCTDEGASKYFEKKGVFGYGVLFPKYSILVEYWEDDATFVLNTDTNYINKRLRDKNAQSSIRLIKRGVVVIPLRDAEGVVKNVQLLFVNEKSFLSGPKSGLFHMFGEVVDNQPIVIGEGYATLASCHMATKWPCVVALDAGNLPKVAKAIRVLFPRHPIIIAGDDDTATKNNAGRKKANEAAKLVGGVSVFPSFDLVETANAA